MGHGATIPWVAVMVVAKLWDWDEVLMIAMGFAGLAWIVVDQKRERRLDLAESELRERVAKLEAQLASDNPVTLPERVAKLEADAEWIAAEVGSQLAIVGRVAKLEEAQIDTVAVCERLVAIETRIDFKPVTHTRGPKGRFASPAVVGGSTCEGSP